MVVGATIQWLTKRLDTDSLRGRCVDFNQTNLDHLQDDYSTFIAQGIPLKTGDPECRSVFVGRRFPTDR